LKQSAFLQEPCQQVGRYGAILGLDDNQVVEIAPVFAETEFVSASQF